MNEVLNEGRGFETVFQEPGCGEMQERRPHVLYARDNREYNAKTH